MSDFYSVLDGQFGDDDDLNDVRVVVRRCWFYDFDGYPVRIWQGKGRLFTTDGNQWLGSIDANDFDHHLVPSITDGRDGSSPTYNFSLNLIDTPDATIQQLYEALKNEQWRASKRTLTCYLVVFELDEGLRPQTPIVFFKELTMMSARFSEKIENDNGKLVKKYVPTIVCKDGNFGRSNTPLGTYADSIQQKRASDLGVSVDKGCEYLAALANRTYQWP